MMFKDIYSTGYFRKSLRHALSISMAAILCLDISSTAAKADTPEVAKESITLQSRTLEAPAHDEDALNVLNEISLGTSRHVIIQLEVIPNAAMRKSFADAGVHLLDYIADKGWFATIEGKASYPKAVIDNVRAIWKIQPQDRLTKSLAEGIVPKHAISDGQVRIKVLAFSDVELAALSAQIEGIGGVIEDRFEDFDTILARVPLENIAQLGEIDGIYHIETPAPTPGSEMNRARAFLNVDSLISAPYNLTGNGVEVGIHDFGHAFQHSDIGARWIQGDAAVQALATSLHASMTAGTIAGDGSLNSTYRGIAPGATLVTYSYEDPTNIPGNRYSDIVLALNRGIDVFNNSWGFFCGEMPYGDYSTEAQIYDRVVRGQDSAGNAIGDPTVVVFSAGNERNGSGNGSNACITETVPPYRNYGTINQPKPAKNIIAVGAIDSATSQMSAYSSWGPVNDGRLKPDVVAGGHHNGTNVSGVTDILDDDCFGHPVGAANQECYRTTSDTNVDSGSTSWDDRYAWFSQTSATAAMVSGSSALLIEDFRARNAGSDPLPSTIKALLIHTAEDLDDGTTWYNPGPDYASGYGLVNVQSAVDQLRTGGYLESCVDQGESETLTLNVPAGSSQVKATLVWDDVPASPTVSGSALVNDLDLIVTDSGGVRHYPWTLDPTTPTANAVRTQEDHLNNVEVVLADSAVSSGDWSVQVTGNSVPSGPQCFSLVYEPVAAAVETCDVDQDGDIDKLDLREISRSRGQPASGPDDPRDANGDGIITVGDVKACIKQCTLASCAVQ